MKIQKILINILKWTLQTVLLSLLPLFFYILIHWMFKLEENPIRRYISELCSFTLVISSSVAIELSQKKYKISSLSCVKDIIFMAYLPLLIIFFVIYGIIYYYLELDIQLNSAILNNMFLAIKIICTIHFIIAFLLQIIGGFYGE
ncbi:MAG: hypothetical protein HFG39_08190 [Lachnospiraceae bacterium]|nr:hypothetical protein [Lachnospiraceae bacterium]